MPPPPRHPSAAPCPARLLAVASALLLCCCLTSCTPEAASGARAATATRGHGAAASDSSSPRPTAGSRPGGETLFTSPQGALRAAQDAYAAYLEIVDRIGIDGGTGIERMRRVTTGEALRGAMTSLTRYVEDEAVTTGSSAFDTVSLERWDRGRSSVSVYLCEDLTDVDVLGPDGVSLATGGGDRRLPFVADFETVSGTLLLARKRLWAGESFC